MEEKTTTALSVIIDKHHLELTDAEQIKQSYMPFFVELAEVKEQSSKINFENPTELDEEIASKLRKKVVKIRTSSEAVKNEHKRIHMLKANIEQDAWNLIKSTCLLDEEKFIQIEKRKELLEKQRIAELTIERQKELEQFKDVLQIDMTSIGAMTDDMYEIILNGAKQKLKDKKEADARAELMRIEIERKNNLFISRRLELAKYADVYNENEPTFVILSIETAEQEFVFMIETARKLKRKKETEQQAIKEENERLRKEKELQIKATQELEIKNKQLQIEAEKKQKELQKELEQKIKIENEAKAKAKAEEERKQKELQMLAKLPEKDKLLIWVNSFSYPLLDASKMSIEAIQIHKMITEKQTQFNEWSQKLINNF